MDSQQDKVLRQTISRSDRIAQWGGWAVVVGLVLDIIIVYFENRPCGEKMFQILADILIAAGVFAELHHGRIASDARDALRLDAEERAAFIEKTYGWRRISRQLRDKVVRGIKGVSQDLVVRIEHQNGDPEAHRLANDIGLMFKDAGVRAVTLVPNSYPFQSKYGLFAAHAQRLDVSWLVNAFANQGMLITLEELDLAQLHFRVNGIAPNLYIYVGMKPWLSSLENMANTDAPESPAY